MIFVVIRMRVKSKKRYLRPIPEAAIRESGLLRFNITLITTILHDFSTEMIGIGIGVWGVDELNRWRSGKEYKREIIRQMASRSNDFALDAARIAKDEGWLRDGSLMAKSFSGANLSGANLWGANLEFANLTKENLESTDLTGVSLFRATLTQAVFDDNTRWPEGFDYRSKGVISIHDINQELYKNEEEWE
jgi:hypothetical protein